MTFHDKTEHAAKGKWRGILTELGVPRDHLNGKHHPCPVCGGTDRWRFDNLEGRGTSICNACGGMSGMTLAMGITGMAFPDCASRIDAMVGNIKPESTPAAPMKDEERRAALRRVVGQTVPVTEGDLVHRYLGTRNLGERIYPGALRFGAALRDGDGGVRPCMVALVGVHGEKDHRGRQRYCSLHRTFLKPDGSGKAEMASPRKMMPGELPEGACVMLSDWSGAGRIGVAEGIETAMAASALFEMPVWAALNATMLAKWLPPEGAEEIAIFGDNDASFAGQAAAYRLAQRLATRQPAPVSVHIPKIPGTDWADEWSAR